jgi:hypothetical protein
MTYGQLATVIVDPQLAEHANNLAEPQYVGPVAVVERDLVAFEPPRRRQHAGAVVDLVGDKLCLPVHAHHRAQHLDADDRTIQQQRRVCQIGVLVKRVDPVCAWVVFECVCVFAGSGGGANEARDTQCALHRATHTLCEETKQPGDGFWVRWCKAHARAGTAHDTRTTNHNGNVPGDEQFDVAPEERVEAPPPHRGQRRRIVDEATTLSRRHSLWERCFNAALRLLVQELETTSEQKS